MICQNCHKAGEENTLTHYKRSAHWHDKCDDKGVCMPAQDWSRVRKAGRHKGSVDANSIPVGVIVAHYGGEVREGKSASVRCCIHNDSRRSAVINTYDNLYYCHTCGKGGSAVDVVME
jgi:hypothetical protein